MSKYDREKALADYNKACDYLAETFVNKQFGKDGEPNITFKDNPDKMWWGRSYNDERLLQTDDSFYTLGEIELDLKEDVPKGMIEDWQDYVIDCQKSEIKPESYAEWLFSIEVVRQYAKKKDTPHS